MRNWKHKKLVIHEVLWFRNTNYFYPTQKEYTFHKKKSTNIVLYWKKFCTENILYNETFTSAESFIMKNILVLYKIKYFTIKNV